MHLFLQTSAFAMIVPLLKDKHGDASRLDMYREITLSSAVSKLFESVLVTPWKDITMMARSLQSSDLQFRFKKQSSCCHAIFTFNETVRYFVKHGGRVHCAELHWYRPQTISATQKTKSATGKVHIGHRSISVTRYRPQTFGKSAVIVMCIMERVSHIICSLRFVGNVERLRSAFLTVCMFCSCSTTEF